MPQINQILKERKKNFIKKHYRPWDFSGEGQVPNSTEDEHSLVTPLNLTETTNTKDNIKDSNEKQIDINNDLFEKQLISKKETIEKQSSNAIDNKEELIEKHKGNKRVTNRNQLSNNIDNEFAINIKEEVRRLTGTQKKILYLVAEICSMKGELRTGPINTHKLAKYILSDYGIAKISLMRLTKKGLIKRLPGKRARGGFINIEITQEIKIAVSQVQKEDDDIQGFLNTTITGNKDIAIGNTIDNRDYISNSSINNLKKTNTTGLPDEWKDIDCEPISHIGFSRTQLLQLYEKNLNLPEVVQESIYHFAFGLENNSKIKEYAEPLNVFMGVLRKGGAWIESNYESPQKRAMRELLERKEKEQQEMEALENRLKDVEFRNWLGTLADEVMNEIVPKQFMNMKEAREGCLKKYFEDNIWAIKKQSLL